MPLSPQIHFIQESIKTIFNRAATQISQALKFDLQYECISPNFHMLMEMVTGIKILPSSLKCLIQKVSPVFINFLKQRTKYFF
jgi:hypothetical protein